MVEPKKKKKPKFNVANLGFFKSVKKRWRKPRGTHNKKRMKCEFMGASPKAGYRNARASRGRHPKGKEERLVRSLAEMESLKGQQVLVRLASAIGARKRKLMEQKAKELKLVILNLKTNGKAPAEKAPPQKT